MKKEKIFAYAVLILICIIAQKSLIPILLGQRHMPDIVLMLVLALAVVEGFDAFFPWAVFAGLAYDLASRTAAGVHVLVFVIVVYCVSFVSRRLLVDMRSTGVIILSFFILLAALVSRALVSAWVGIDTHSMRNAVGAFGSGWDIAAGTAYNLLAFCVIFCIARKYKKKNPALISRG